MAQMSNYELDRSEEIVKLGSNITESAGTFTIGTAGWYYVYWKITDHNNTISWDFYLRIGTTNQDASRSYSEVNSTLGGTGGAAFPGVGGYYGEMMGRHIELSADDTLNIYGTGRIYGQGNPDGLSWFGGFRLGA